MQIAKTVVRAEQGKQPVHTAWPQRLAGRSRYLWLDYNTKALTLTRAGSSLVLSLLGTPLMSCCPALGTGRLLRATSSWPADAEGRGLQDAGRSSCWSQV